MQTETGVTPNANGETPEATQKPVIAPEIQAIIDAQIAEATKKANAEAAASRVKLKEITDAQKAAADAKLADEKRFEELAAQRAAELAAAQSRLSEMEQYKTQVETMTAKRHAELLAKVPEANRPALAGFTVDQLEAVVGILPNSPGQSQGSDRQQSNQPAAAPQPLVPFAGANSDVQASLLKILGG